MALVTRPDGELVAVAGASRMGKTTFCVQRAHSWRRMLMWDGADDHRKYACTPIASLAELRDRIVGPPRLERLAYTPPDLANTHELRRDFEIFCRLAWGFIRKARSALVVEETSDVTHPGKAQGAWGAILRKGLRYGPLIVATTQRPAEADTTAFGNAGWQRTFRLVRPEDWVSMAKRLGVDVEEVAALQPYQWIERDPMGRITRGAGARIRAKGTPRGRAQA